MKPIHEVSVQTDFSFSVPTRVESPIFSWLRTWVKRKTDYLAVNRRELLITAAATVGISMVILAASYLFFVQLAAYGW